MPGNGTRNASSSSSRNPNSERITDMLQRGKTHVGHLQTRISPVHPRLLPLQVPHRPLPAKNNTITTVEVLSTSNHLKPTLLQPERSARAQTTLLVQMSDIPRKLILRCKFNIHTHAHPLAPRYPAPPLPDRAPRARTPPTLCPACQPEQAHLRRASPLRS